MLTYEKHLKRFARRLRVNMTGSEQMLWLYLRRRQIAGMQFYRQKPLGPYVVDFYAPTARLVIEVDGSQHFHAEGKQQDEARDAWLRQQGLTVLRFDNLQVLRETRAVLERIVQTVDVGWCMGRGDISFSAGMGQIPSSGWIGKIPPTPPFSKGGASRGDKSPPLKKGGGGGISQRSNTE